MLAQPVVTHIGGPTALIEFGGWRLVTDPTFDPGEDRYYSMQAEAPFRVEGTNDRVRWIGTGNAATIVV